MSGDHLAGPPRRLGIPLRQETATACQAESRPFGDDYSWHPGIAASVSAPQPSSQVRTSSPVR